MLIDTHAHFMESQFSSDLSDVLARARDVGVSKMVNVGCTEVASEKSVEMAGKYDFLYATQGLHPSNFEDFSEKLMVKFFEAARGCKKVVAIGETGLDYHYKNANPTMQQKSFRAQMKLAEELDLPIIIHCRDASNTDLSASRDMISLMKEFPKVRCVMHCFAQDRQYADEILKMPQTNPKGGHLFSFSGIVTYPKTDEIRFVAGMVPEDRIVVETDSPYLPPQMKRGQRNETAWIMETTQKLAEIRGVSFEDVCEMTTKNAERFFGM